MHRREKGSTTVQNPVNKPARPQVTPLTPYDELPQWMTLREAAVCLGVSYWTVREMIHSGEMPHKRFGRVVEKDDRKARYTSNGKTCGKLIFVPKSFFRDLQVTAATV